ncbi:MAG: glycosyltransferase [Desulfobacteraceae bacterium]|nr:MAG: glycosyltransferase [Desulfobacteraceae bacterium]
MSIRPPKNCIIVFLRAPESGKVKTRLSGELGSEATLVLYQNFVMDILHTVHKANTDILIFFCPEEAEALVSKWLGNHDSLHPQAGENLGIRMANAFIHAFSSGYDRAVLIGTDCPEITEKILREAFSEIDDTGCVIGPSMDGGYYLIGFKKKTFTEKVFHDVTWGTGVVYGQTLERCGQADIHPHILPRLNDIDTLDDLILFYRKHPGHKMFRSHTIRCMIETRLSGESK